jgi:hypothetical protein
MEKRPVSTVRAAQIECIKGIALGSRSFWSRTQGSCDVRTSDRQKREAKELKDVLRKTLDENDRILVVEVSGGWASRRAENNLGELVPPKGGPALALWKQRWGE